MLQDKVRETLEGRIIAKAWESDSYRAALKQNPKAVILDEMKDVFGSQAAVPENWEVAVHEETDNSFHLVIPHNPDEQPDVLVVKDLSPSAQQCNTPDTTRCGMCSINTQLGCK
jgi:hypothetical protein